MQTRKLSRIGIAAAVLPNLVMLLLFYSVALHMYRSLGGWPEGYGDRGMPFALIAHRDIAGWTFILLLWFGIFFLPLWLTVSSFVKRLRHMVPYLCLWAISFGLCWFAMNQGPGRFVDWWWD